MATSKTLAPTNVTVQIPAMTDAPDMAVPANAIDKTIDAVNALNSQINNNATMPSDANFNDYETAGSFYFASATSMTNPPRSNAGYGLLLVFGYKTGNNVRIMQVCITSGYHLYVRRHVSTSSDAWSDWREVTMTALT